VALKRYCFFTPILIKKEYLHSIYHTVKTLRGIATRFSSPHSVMIQRLNLLRTCIRVRRDIRGKSLAVFGFRGLNVTAGSVSEVTMLPRGSVISMRSRKVKIVRKVWFRTRRDKKDYCLQGFRGFTWTAGSVSAVVMRSRDPILAIFKSNKKSRRMGSHMRNGLSPLIRALGRIV
jgi:hypothetical protein